MQEAAVSQPVLMSALEKEGETQVTRHGSQALVRGREQTGLGWPRAGLHVKTRTRRAPVGHSSCGMEMAMFSLEESPPSGPGLCPSGVLAQTLAVCIPLDPLMTICLEFLI